MLRARGGASMPELAAMRGDKDLAAWLAERGFRTEPRVVACPWEWTPARQRKAPDLVLTLGAGAARVASGQAVASAR